MSEGDRVPVTVGEWPDDTDSDEGVVINWFVREGRSVEEGESLCEIQVEKVSLDVFAPTNGMITEVVHDEDDEFARGDTLVWMEPA